MRRRSRTGPLASSSTRNDRQTEAGDQDMTIRDLRNDLTEALRKLGHTLDQASDPATMRRLIRRRKDLTVKLEARPRTRGRYV
jgi:hypothetical protein